MSVGRDSATAAIGDGAMWLFGGSSDAEVSGTSELLRLDLAAPRWSVEQPTGERPAPRLAAGLGYASGALWMLGGLMLDGMPLGTPLSDVWRFDLGARTWARQPIELDLPLAASSVVWDTDCHTLLVLGDLGGSDASGAVWALRGGDRAELVSLPPMPLPRALSAVALDRVGRTLIVYGGYDGETGTADVQLGRLGACP